MSKNDKKKTGSKERGLNVRVEKELKAEKNGDVRVNSYFEKNDTRRKNKKSNAKNAAKTAKSEEKAEAKSEKVAKTSEKAKNSSRVAEKKVNTKEHKSETKKPASFSKAKKAGEEPLILLPEKFETLKIDTTEKSKKESKIVLRDVAKEKPIRKVAEPKKAEIKKELPKPVVKPVEKTIPKPAVKKSAKEIKEAEIEKAIKTATKLPEARKTRRRFDVGNFGWTRAILAVACATTAIFAVVYFVNLTSTDMSLKVAAMQSGIEAVYPSYIPRGYNLSDVTSASGKVSMSFKSDEGMFTLTEENSTWDSTALLNNYIKEYYTDDEYTVVREQGLTLYMGDSWEAWVNGGMLYRLNVKSGSLTKKQLKTIATSL